MASDFCYNPDLYGLEVGGNFYSKKPFIGEGSRFILCRRLTVDEMTDRDDVLYFNDMEYVRKLDWTVDWTMAELTNALETDNYRIG